ncbi:hypothetical protein HPO_08279 [Hyphomonas polymorpha PS728]|uniref:Uncharacterized protein n=1 Tax=Hyphomonas polymorpha PS728 TaxID=1280954 RepID=A0A062VHE1_9PROT|nr:hypothetical protein [Hyphomonas polymorpha]KCZ98882.1 hypothetical protein HPO_08279 [Hyphomonas polymorpha PS728]
MTADGEVSGIQAVNALLRLQETLGVSDKDWAAAAGMIAKKLLLSAGQTPETLTQVRAAIGEEAFNVQLKSLTHHQARQLARRLDKRVPDFEVSTASAAAAHVRKLLAAVKLPEIPQEPATEPKAEIKPPPRPLLDRVSDNVPPPPAEDKPEAAAEKPKTEPESEEKKDAWGAGTVRLTDDTETATEEETETDSTSPPPPPPPGSAYFGRKSFRT